MARYTDLNKLEEAVIQSKENNPHLNSIQRQMHIHEHRHFLCMLNQAPTADVVEVIRCVDCIHFVDNSHIGFQWCRRECKNLTVKPDDFCSYGEREVVGGRS